MLSQPFSIQQVAATCWFVFELNASIKEVVILPYVMRSETGREKSSPAVGGGQDQSLQPLSFCVAISATGPDACDYSDMEIEIGNKKKQRLRLLGKKIALFSFSICVC